MLERRRQLFFVVDTLQLQLRNELRKQNAFYRVVNGIFRGGKARAINGNEVFNLQRDTVPKRNVIRRELFFYFGNQRIVIDVEIHRLFRCV